MRGGTRGLNLIVDKLHVAACDCRRYSEQPQKYGVNVYQGALTVYNFNGDDASTIKASLTDITAGSRNAPVIGSGVFISSFSEIVTYGVNDMVLDTWGTMENWIAHAPVVSYGPSGIGFVNFGTVDTFVARSRRSTSRDRCSPTASSRTPWS